ncbi:cytochrome P450 domain-containing protein [Rhizoctonia solani AG-1 IA]|uniref:Cytochrome P450 domain-containing protein n=1 Tax=Thanatephorus cucumeris (strain AG1-IA) TaxID=983506 RepID=L8WMR7_THACA|nr:cytochrome P450 domain-containing protein [Rhizoctonia solani AG-1 IA]
MEGFSTHLPFTNSQDLCRFVGLISLLIFLLYWGSKREQTSLSLPPSPKADPFIGHIRFLPSGKEHITYKQWGDIISLNMMGQIIIVLNSAEAANEILVHRAARYSDRPHTGWGNNTAFLPYGERWRKQRRMTHEVLHKKASEDFWPIITRKSRHALCQLLSHPKNVEGKFKHMAACMILSSAYGYDVSSSDEELVKIVEAANKGLCQSALAGSVEEKDKMLHTPFDWTRVQMTTGTATPSMLTSLLLKLASQKKDQKELKEEEDRIRWTVGTMFKVQHNAQMELDALLGGGRLPELADRPHLPYIERVIKEVCRWRPVTPLAIPHRCIKDDYYKGYRIPQGAMV